MIISWFYYSFAYMLLSIFITLVINKLTGKLWLTPLLINGICAILLISMAKFSLISSQAATYSMYYHYLPVVTVSFVTNLCIYFHKKIKAKMKGAL